MILRNFVLFLDNFHYRSFILSSAAGIVIRHTEDDDRTQYQRAIIHALPIDRLVRWPKCEKPRQQQVCTREYIDRYPKGTRKMPGSPSQSCATGVCEGGGGVGMSMVDAAGATSIEEEEQGDEVGGVEAGDTNGEDVVEGDGGAEVDEGKKGRGEGGYGYAPDGECGAGTELCEGIALVWESG